MREAQLFGVLEEAWQELTLRGGYDRKCSALSGMRRLDLTVIQGALPGCETGRCCGQKCLCFRPHQQLWKVELKENHDTRL